MLQCTHAGSGLVDAAGNEVKRVHTYGTPWALANSEYESVQFGLWNWVSSHTRGALRWITNIWTRSVVPPLTAAATSVSGSATATPTAAAARERKGIDSAVPAAAAAGALQGADATDSSKQQQQQQQQPQQQQYNDIYRASADATTEVGCW
jgi:hypothetical protein